MMWELVAGVGIGLFAVVGAYAYVVRPKYAPCCFDAMRKGRNACYELEGISAFGDVVEKCRYCDTREVFVFNGWGKNVELLIFNADKWKELRGKVPTEGFQSAQRVAARARASRGSNDRRQGAAGER